MRTLVLCTALVLATSLSIGAPFVPLGVRLGPLAAPVVAVKRGRR